MPNDMTFASGQEKAELSFKDQAELRDAYNNCVSNPDPQLKLEACRRYEELNAQAGQPVSQGISALSGAARSRGFADGGVANGPEVFADGPMIEEEEEYQIPLMDRASAVLDDDDYGLLSEAVDMHPELPRIFDEILMSVEEFEGEGPVEGPGTETSDSIPAKLSDGEFVFTAKSVKQLGVDKLYRMMKKAEEDFDSSTASDQEFAMGGFVQRKCK